MALKKSMINKLEKHNDNYVLLWITATHEGSILRYMPELKNCKIENPMMHGSRLYLYDVQNKNAINTINKIDDNLDIYKVAGNNLTYDEIKSVIEDGVKLNNLEVGKTFATYNHNTNKVINFKHIEINDL